MDIRYINGTVKVLVDEESLPSKPDKWDLGDYAYLVGVIQREYPGGAIKIINTKTLEDLGDITGVGDKVHIIEVHPNRGWIYTISRDGIVSKIDLYSLQIVRQVRIGVNSRGLAISHDGRYIIAGNYEPNGAVVLDAETLRPLSIIVAAGINPDGFAVRSRVANVYSIDKYGLFAINLKEAGQVWFIEQRPPFRVVRSITVGRILHEINALDPEERYIAITSQVDNTYTIIDVEKLKIVNVIRTPETPHLGPGTLDVQNGLWFGNSVKEANVTVIDVKSGKLAGYVWPPGIDVKKGEGCSPRLYRRGKPT